jgi:phenylalanyl-tRNA synthetase beta chain
MKISLNWLKEFVEVPAGARELKRDLTNLGLNVESYAQAGNDWVLEVEVTTNRPDCLSHLGVAREVATFYRKPLKRPSFRVKDLGDPAKAEISIETEDRALCPRYCGRVVRNVQVKPSPAWLARRLEAVGMRPINNVADVTNYVLMELGHPLHAFDLERIRGRQIIVRRARAGEKLRTLDGVDRTLTQENLVIADGEGAVALAGVMGGEESEISPATTSVLLESAWFDPLSIRRTAKAQGLHTEASHRFERGADINMAPVALDRAALMIAELAGGEILRGMVGVFPAAKPRKDIVLDRKEIIRILGAEISWEDVRRILQSLGFETIRRGTEGWRVSLPSFRLDVARSVDLIEEVARHYGYDRLPARVRPAPLRKVEQDNRRERELALVARLVDLGYREIIPPAMVDPEENSRFADRPPVPLANPLSQDASAMRSSTVPSMLHALRWNLDRGQLDLRFFELGKTYTLRAPRSPAEPAQPEEPRVLTLGLSGNRRSASVHDTGKAFDFFDLKGDLEALLGAFDLPDWRFEPDGCSYYQKDCAGRFISNGETLAVLGRLSAEIAREYKLRQDVWLAEVDADRLLEAPLREHVFSPYSKFPTVERDFSLLVPDEVAYTRLEEAVRSAGVEEIQSFRPVDRKAAAELAPGAIPEKHYSLLLRVTFQSTERTLTGEEIEQATRRLLAALETLGVRVRG